MLWADVARCCQWTVLQLGEAWEGIFTTMSLCMFHPESVGNVYSGGCWPTLASIFPFVWKSGTRNLVRARWCIRHFSLRGWNRSPTVAFLVFFSSFFAVEQNEEYFWTTVTAARLKKKRKSRREHSLRSVKDAWLFVRGWRFVCLYASVCASLSSSGLCASGATKSVPD